METGHSAQHQLCGTQSPARPGSELEEALQEGAATESEIPRAAPPFPPKSRKTQLSCTSDVISSRWVD